MLTYLSRPKTLWILFFATLVMTLAFGLVMYIWEFGIIDEMYNAEHIRAHIEAMTPKQRKVHAWMTATLDVAYPFAYGGFFIGVALKAFKRAGLWLALPAMLVIPADLIEGVSQVFLLTGHEGFMPVKLIATPTKLILYITALMIAVIGLIKLATRRFRQQAH